MVAPIEPTLYFSGDVTAGAIVFERHFDDTVGLIFGGELGYAGSARDLHLFNLAGAIDFGTPWIGVTYQPRLLAGVLGEETAVGMRNGMALHAVFSVISLEVGHQFMSSDDTLHHDVHVLLGLNVGGAIYLMYTALAGIRPGG